MNPANGCALAAALLTALCCGCVASFQIGGGTAPGKAVPGCTCGSHACVAAHAPATSQNPIELNTYTLETGQIRLTDASDTALEQFMQDLNRRKDFAIACMDGGASADSEYLWTWLSRVCDEMRRRGYEFDSQGNIYHGNTLIALR